MVGKFSIVIHHEYGDHYKLLNDKGDFCGVVPDGFVFRLVNNDTAVRLVNGEKIAFRIEEVKDG